MPNSRKPAASASAASPASDGRASRAALATSTAPTSAFTGAPPFGSIRPSSVRPFTNSTAPMKNRLTADKGLQRT